MSGSEALRRGAAWSDLSSRGRLVATGEDRQRLIHAISSNGVEELAPGRGTYAFFLNAQGRIQSDSHIFVDRDHVLIDCEPEANGPLQAHIESYIIMDDVVLEDVSATTRLVAVAGPQSRGVISALDLPAPDEALSFARSGEIRVIRVPVGTTDAYWLLGPRSETQRLVEQIEANGAVPSTRREFEALRVSNGVPRFGLDFGPENIPHETQQLNAVSFAKGCYTGQEIVERVRSLGRVRRLLAGVELESPSPPEDLTVHHDGRPVGTMTSPTPGCGPDGSARGFAIVRREAAAPGTDIHVGGLPGRILDVSRE